MSNWDKIILKSEVIDLSSDTLLKIIDGKSTIHRYSDLDSIKTLKELLGVNQASVLVYQHTSDFGHFVAVFMVDDHTVEVYDPYGIPVDSELQFSEENLRIHNGVPTPHLSTLIQNSGLTVIHNTQRNQQFLRNVETCGKHCGHRLFFRKMPLKEYNKLFKKNRFNADWMVSAMTLMNTLNN